MQKLPHEPSFEQAKILVAGDLNIIDTVIRRGTFTTFIRLVEGSSLEKTLRSESPFTLFAPADMAFTGLPADTLKQLLEPQNEHRLTEILWYHVVRGRFDCKQLEQIKTARTKQGHDLKIDLRQTILVDSARIVIKDIDATNGIIHGIDSLLMPCAVAATAIQRPLPLQHPDSFTARALGELSNDLKEFIARHFHSVILLEVLLLLSENRAKAWSADAVDRKLNLSPHSAKAHLDEMLSQGLLTLVDEEERYGYQPSSDELNKMVNQLSNAYATQRVSRTNNNFLKSVRIPVIVGGDSGTNVGSDSG